MTTRNEGWKKGYEMAIASWAESLGFSEDAAVMREFAAKVRPAFEPRNRKAVPA